MTETIEQPTKARTAPKPGVYRRVPFAEYAAWDAVNWHTLEPGRKSAKAMRHRMLHPDDPSASILKGGAMDCLVFDGEEAFGRTYVTLPKFDGHPNSNAYKQQKQEWEARHAEAVILTRDQMAETWGMYHALKAHPVAWQLLTGGRGRSQFSIVWRDAKTGLLCKGRIDRLAEVDAALIAPGAAGKTLCLIDLKSTREPGVEGNQFPAEIARYGYHGQIGGYCEGCETLEPAAFLPLIVAVQNEEPFDVVVHRLDGEASSDGRTVIDHGRALYRRLLDLYAACRKTAVWPGQCSVINPVTLPYWAQEQGANL